MITRSIVLGSALLLAACSSDRLRVDSDIGGRPSLSGGAGGPRAESDAGLPDAGSGRCDESTLLASFSPLRTLYVGPTGTDGNDGLTPATAWRSLRNVAQLQPGDRVDIAPGTYPCEVTIAAQATATAPIVFHSTERHGAVFDCVGAAYGFQILGARYVALDGIDVRGAVQDAVRIGAAASDPTAFADHVVIANGALESGGGAAIRALGGTSIDVVDEEITRALSALQREDAVGIDLLGVRTARVLQSRFHDMPANAALRVRAGAEGALLDGNVFFNVLDAVHLGGTSTPGELIPRSATVEATAVAAVNNVIYRDVAVPFLVAGCASCLIANNTVYVSGAQTAVRSTAGGGAVGASRTTQLRILNDIFAFATRPQRLLDIDDADAQGLTQGHNLLFLEGASAGGIPSRPVLGGDTLLDQDPQLQNPSLSDLRLAVGSPAVGRGSVVPEVKRDATGACRSELNIGAY